MQRNNINLIACKLSWGRRGEGEGIAMSQEFEYRRQKSMQNADWWRLNWLMMLSLFLVCENGNGSDGRQISCGILRKSSFISLSDGN